MNFDDRLSVCRQVRYSNTLNPTRGAGHMSALGPPTALDRALPDWSRRQITALAVYHVQENRARSKLLGITTKK